MSYQMSGAASITIMGRVTEDVKTRSVTTKSKGAMEVYDLSVAVNSWVAGKEVVTFFNITLWPGRFDGMIPLLERGKAVYLSGEFHMSSYSNESGTRSHRLVVELGQLKFGLRDSNKLIAKKLKNQKQKEAEDQKNQSETLDDLFDDEDKLIVKDQMENKTIPLKRKSDSE